MSFPPGGAASALRNEKFVSALHSSGFDFFCGVPCSLLAGVLGILEEHPAAGYVSVVREDAALGLAAGAALGGGSPVVFMQNSGLGVSVNALTSLNRMYELPVLLVISWRGEGGKDAPEHIQTGAIMNDLLDLIEIPFEVLDCDRIEEQVGELARTMRRTRLPVALVVRRGILQ